jgi:hypothetical protein
MEEDIIKLREEQDAEMKRLESERASADETIQTEYTVSIQEEEELKKQIALDEAKFLEEQGEEARLSKIALEAQQQADQAEQDRLLSEAAEESAEREKTLVSDTEKIRDDAEAALEDVQSREEELASNVLTAEEAREALESGNILDTFDVTCRTRTPVTE